MILDFKVIKRICDSVTIHLESIDNIFFAKIRRRKLNNTDFSIISNNCWGGHVYRRYGLNYLSPTVGLYFFTEDYLLFLEDLQNNLKKDIRFIKYNQSKYKEILIEKGQTHIPIGVLGDNIEIMFLHYKTEKEAYEKWNRRAKRTNFDNLIIKMSQMNLCTEVHLRRFDNLPYKKKIAFVSKYLNTDIKSAVPIYKYSNEERVIDDTTYFSKHIDLVKLINDDTR